MNIHTPLYSDAETVLVHFKETLVSLIRLGLSKDATEREISSLFDGCGYVVGEFTVESHLEDYVCITFVGTVLECSVQIRVW